MEDTSHPPQGATQQERLRDLIAESALLRAHELRTKGIAPETIARAVRSGQLTRLSRGLYQATNAQIDENQTLAEAAKRVPKGVIGFISALAFHGLTDQMPRKVWMAIGPSDWSPAPSYPPMHIVRLSQKYFGQGIEQHKIAGVAVPIYAITKTLADAFRNPKLIDRSVAIESLRAALDQRKATPSAIAEAAREGGAWNIMQPYLEALTANG